MAITIFNITPPDGNAYIYSEDKDLLMTFAANSPAHLQFIKAAKEHGDLVLTISNYGQAIERVGKDLADEHFTQVEEITFKKYIKYGVIALLAILIINTLRK